MSSTPAPRFPALDLLRLVAISLTVLTHTPNLVSRVPGLRSTQNGLWLGVDLFMLISGWLLGGQLLREEAASGLRPWRFYVKRWLRTLPAYWFMLAALYHIPNAPEFKGPLPWRVILTHVTFTQIYAGRNDYMVSWSLCVEEHFYLLLPLVVWVLRRASLRTVAIAVFAIEAIGVAARAFDFDPRESIPFLTHQRCHGLFLGFLFAFAAQRAPLTWSALGRFTRPMGWLGIFGTIAVLCSLDPAPNRWMFIGAPTVGTWAFAMLFIPCIHPASPWSRFRFRGLAYLGGLTYSIYLTHNVMPRPIVEYMGGAGTIKGVLWRVLLMGCAALFVHHIVERPFLRLRDWLLTKRSDSAK